MVQEVNVMIGDGRAIGILSSISTIERCVVDWVLGILIPIVHVPGKICSTTDLLSRNVLLFCPQDGFFCQCDRPGRLQRSVSGQEGIIRSVVV